VGIRLREQAAEGGIDSGTQHGHVPKCLSNKKDLGALSLDIDVNIARSFSILVAIYNVLMH
jgi:hypothetical protein